MTKPGMEPDQARSRLILASASPRRRQLLAQLGILLDVEPPGIDESVVPSEGPAEYVARLARQKGLAVGKPGRVVLAADTSVVIDGQVLGKPNDPDDARRMLEFLSGRRHQVMTGVFASGPGGHFKTVVTTKVLFRKLSCAEVAWYVATREPDDKAGAYAIQERGGAFVESIEGSYSNVVGLPLAESLDLLRKAGFEWPVSD